MRYCLTILLIFALNSITLSEILLIAQIFRHTDRYPILNFNSTEFEYSGKPTFQGLLNAEKKGEDFYNQYTEFVESLEPKNIKNIISNVTRNIVTSYFKLKGMLSNTRHVNHIDFRKIFQKDSFNKSLDYHINYTRLEISREEKQNSDANSIHNHSIHKHHFEQVEFKENIKSFLKNEEESTRIMTDFLKEHFSTFIPKLTDVYYFGHLKDENCVRSIITKLFGSFLFEHILEFLDRIKDKHGETLKKFYDYLNNAEQIIHEGDKKAVKAYLKHEYLKLFIISDFIVSSYLSDLTLSEEEKKMYEDLKSYYSLIVRSLNFNSDIIELLSSKTFEEIIKVIKSYKYLLSFKPNSAGVLKEIFQGAQGEINNQNLKQKIYKEQIKKIYDTEQEKKAEIKHLLENSVKKLILISSHDTYISSNLWFLGINANLFEYSYNDEINLILHYDPIEYDMYLEIKYNDKTVIPEFCSRHKKLEKICDFEKFIEFLEKRTHREELLQDFCMEDIDAFPPYLDRTPLIKEDL